MNWEGSTKHLTQYPKTKDEITIGQAEAFHRMGKRRASHHSTEHELEDQLAEWANMTGFLVALGGICLKKQSPENIRLQQQHQDSVRFKCGAGQGELHMVSALMIAGSRQMTGLSQTVKANNPNK